MSGSLKENPLGSPAMATLDEEEDDPDLPVTKPRAAPPMGAKAAAPETPASTRPARVQEEGILVFLRPARGALCLVPSASFRILPFGKEESNPEFLVSIRTDLQKCIFGHPFVPFAREDSTADNYSIE